MFSIGSHGPRGWSTLYPECAAKYQSPVDIADEQALVSDEYQELELDKFNTESSNQTTMKNTGKTGQHLEIAFLKIHLMRHQKRNENGMENMYLRDITDQPWGHKCMLFLYRFWGCSDLCFFYTEASNSSQRIQETPFLDVA